jgi:acyl-CoA thioesterase I
MTMKKKIATLLSITTVFIITNLYIPPNTEAAQNNGTSIDMKAHSLTGIKKITNENINGVILGDSIAVSQGAKNSLTNGWDSNLNTLLGNKYSNKILWSNKASSGTLVDYCLLRAQEIDNTTDVVFICVGRNDRNYYTANQFSLKYKQLIRLIQRNAPNADIFCIIEPPMVSSDDSLFMGIKAAIVFVSNNMGVNLLDVWSAFPTNQTALASLLSDGLHPNVAGYMQMSNYIYNRLISMIKSTQ